METIQYQLHVNATIVSVVRQCLHQGRRCSLRRVFQVLIRLDLLSTLLCCVHCTWKHERVQRWPLRLCTHLSLGLRISQKYFRTILSELNNISRMLLFSAVMVNMMTSSNLIPGQTDWDSNTIWICDLNLPGSVVFLLRWHVFVLLVSVSFVWHNVKK